MQKSMLPAAPRELLVKQRELEEKDKSPYISEKDS
jgi:hypothetical protein